MNWLLEHYKLITSLIGSLYVVATAIAALTPTGKDNTWLEKVGAFFDRVGFQIKKK